MGITKSGTIREVFNSDDKKYGGSGMHNKALKVTKTPWHGRDKSVEITLPPLAVVIFQ
jgi:1,4-alpha-glucan branching enzyme